MSEFYSSKLNSFGTASIPKLVLQFSVPSIVSMLVNALYNIVDRLFVGQEVGSLGIAGITLCFPIMLFIMAMSMMIGVGGNTLFAIRLGQKKYIQASIILNNSFSLLLLMAATTFTLGEIFMEPLLRLFGASDQTLPVASSYMRILLCGAVFQTVAPGMNHFIRSMGHPKTAMFREVIGAVTNIALDWLFIVQFRWGIEGAAWATIGSQLVAASLITQFFVKKNTPIRIRWRHMKLRFAYVRKIIILGIPPSIMQV
ncbi:MATE family efflux transporter, partial [Fibrobacter succinogenes]|uniref:MATE family efflux transporter n=1 Tax=Fibrobacter succinogenes TaxID=833 RepID=UPI00156619F3